MLFLSSPPPSIAKAYLKAVIDLQTAILPLKNSCYLKPSCKLPWRDLNFNTISGTVGVHSPITTVLSKENVLAFYESDVQILTTGGLHIPVHSSVLMSALQVLENIIDRPRKHSSSKKVIPILSVPCSAVSSFIGFLYTARCTEEEMEKFGIHLLALSHVYAVPQLKLRCTKGLGERLMIENVVDILQLARLCDAPDLYLKCMKLVASRFKAVEKTEGWKFSQDHDPGLKL